VQSRASARIGGKDNSNHWLGYNLKLDRSENYIVAYYRLPGARNTSLWTWLIIKCLLTCLFAYSLFNADQALTVTAFGTLFLLDLYSLARAPRWNGLIGSAFDKYENRIRELEQMQSSSSLSSSSAQLTDAKDSSDSVNN